MKYHIAPSILNCDFTKLGKTLSTFRKAGIDTIHLDIMDGQFVPTISFGSLLVKDIDSKYFTKDVHLMVKDPISQVEAMANAGANIITFHYESCSNNWEIANTISAIKAVGCQVGLAINPDTPIEEIRLYLSDIDLILVMSVQPGKGGQTFNDIALEKLKGLKELRKNNGYNYLLEVDGGINPSNAHACKTAGADLLVVGSYLFSGDENLEDKLNAL